jgi:anti-anti-sigma regulatory factor
MADCTIAREWEGDRPVLRLAGVFDREVAWLVRERIDRDAAPELLLDFSLVREFSDLGVAVLAHALQETPRRVLLRGLRQHQVRIFRYCGLRVDDHSPRDLVVGGGVTAAAATL